MMQEDMLTEGEQHAITLYTWRSHSRGIPQPKSNADPNRAEIYGKSVEVLKPGVDKLFNLLNFQKTAVQRFCKEVKMLCHVEKRKEFVSEAYLLTLGKFINMCAILDELKNIKSSVKNDYSAYKRASQFLPQCSTDVQSLQESHGLSVFLGTQNIIRNSLKEVLEKIENHQELLIELINICVTMFETKMYVTPNEKHMLVKVIGFSLDLIDSENFNIYKVDQKKKIRIERIDKIFASLPVVPLYGDMQISPFTYVKRSKHFVPSKWPQCSAMEMRDSVSPSPEINIVKIFPEVSSQHWMYLSELNALCCSGTTSTGLNRNNKRLMNCMKDNEGWCPLVLKGIQLLSEWNCAVSELYSWKLLHPTDHHLNRECPVDSEEYERAIRYNYTSREKSSIVHVIAAIKSLQTTLGKLESTFSVPIREEIYLKLQTFVQMTLREPIRKAAKHKYDVLKSVLLAIRDTCADWTALHGNPNLDPVLKGEKGDSSVPSFEIVPRAVGPSSTQLYLMRTMVESIISEKTCAGKSLRKEVDRLHLPVLEDFHKITFFWKYLLNFTEMLQQCCNLSQFWYREFYLEMTMGQRIQFPIRTSFPYILVDHLLENPSKLELALYPFDLYNDTANCALTVFRKQFLYDEVEAELNLCFDYFVDIIGKLIFCHYQKIARAIFLEKKKGFQSVVGALCGTKFSSPADPQRFVALMKQKRVHLLGHYIDLSKLITQRVSNLLLVAVTDALNEFVADDLTTIVRFEATISLTRETHKLLKKELSGLDEFECIWKTADRSLTAAHGRTTRHIIRQIKCDILQNYCYNGVTYRFVKSKVSASAPESDTVSIISGSSASTLASVATQFSWGSGSDQHNKIFSALFSQYTGFFGQPHLETIVNLVGSGGVARIFRSLTRVIKKSISEQGTLYQCTKMISELMPKTKKVPLKPLVDQESPGILAFYLQLFQPLIQKLEVRVEALQEFRRIGNAVLLWIKLEQSLAVYEAWKALYAAPIQDLFSGKLTSPQGSSLYKPWKKTEDPDLKPEAKVPVSEVKNVNHATMAAIRLEGEADEQNGLDLDANSAIDCSSPSRFLKMLKEIREVLRGDPLWSGPPPENDIMHLEDACVEFHRYWSALQFIFCIPPGKQELSVESV